MTDERRSEMRRYRDLAITRESELNKRRTLLDKRDSKLSFTVRTDGMVLGRVDSKEETNVVDNVISNVTLVHERDICSTEATNVQTPIGITQDEPLRIPIDDSEISFQSCSSKILPSGYSSDDSTFRSNSHRYYSSTTYPNEDETTDASLTFRPTSSGATHLDEYLVDLSINSKISKHTVVPIVAIDSDNFQRPRLLRSNSYTLDEPSPAFLKHLQLQALNAYPTDEKQDDEISEKNIVPPKVTPTVCTRRNSLDTTATINSNNRKPKSGVFKKTPGNGGAASRRGRPAFERVYSTKAVSSIAPKSGSTNQRKPAVVINGLSVEGQKVNNSEVSTKRKLRLIIFIV